jgi:MFS family permease
MSTIESSLPADRRFLISGGVLLAVAMGIGRFAYTPLLPIMERDAGLSVSMAGTLAFSNLFGYLVGASLAMVPFTHRHRLAIVRWSVGAIIATTGLMAWSSDLWIPLRFSTGVASGFVLIFASSIVLERAAHQRRPNWPPLFFSGVGFGIAFSGVAVPWFVPYGGSRAAWIGLAAISFVSVASTSIWFVEGSPRPHAMHGATELEPASRSGNGFSWLLAVYTGEAFAYVIPATFLSAIASHVPSLAHYAAATWVVVGLSGAFATFLWIRIAARTGKAKALALALGLQAIGIVAPALSRSPVAVIFAAVALGGTFMAITLFAAGLARDIFPHRTSAAVSRLTVFYSAGQMLGPLAATGLALRFGSYASALASAAAIAGVAAIATLRWVRDPDVVLTRGSDAP